MTPPIVILDGGDIIVFESVEDAEAWVEVSDVENNLFSAYDSTGILLKFDVVTTNLQRRFLWFSLQEPVKRVVINETTSPTDKSIELREALVEFLSWFGKPRNSLSSLSLPELVMEVSRYSKG